MAHAQRLVGEAMAFIEKEKRQLFELLLPDLLLLQQRVIRWQRKQERVIGNRAHGMVSGCTRGCDQDAVELVAIQSLQEVLRKILEQGLSLIHI